MLAPEPCTLTRPGLDRLNELLADDVAAADRVIHEGLASCVPLIPRLSSYLIDAGGKRIRPLLMLACARLCGFPDPAPAGIAAGIEYIHTATLLHDDVVDDSDIRRGQDSAKALWGNKASVLVGDFLIARAFELMVDAGNAEVLRILSRASAVIAEGEVMQLTATRNLATTESHYMAIIRGKTAALFAAACEAGAAVAGADAGTQAALAEFGLALGLAFQLTDDVLDYAAGEGPLGKPGGNDFAEGKLTLPVILALERADDAERAFWERTLGQLQQEDGDLAKAAGLLHRHGSLDATRQRARVWCAQAEECLNGLPASAIRMALQAVVAYIGERAEPATHHLAK